MVYKKPAFLAQNGGNGVFTGLPGSWDKTMRSISHLIDSGIPVQISCPVMKINRDSCRDVTHIDTRCPDAGFCYISLMRNANEDPEGNPLKINKHFCKVAALNRKIVLDWKAKLQGAMA